MQGLRSLMAEKPTSAVGQQETLSKHSISTAERRLSHAEADPFERQASAARVVTVAACLLAIAALAAFSVSSSCARQGLRTRTS